MFDRFFLVGLPRFELGQTEPKPVVLPLHHSPILIPLSFGKRCKDKHIFGNNQIYLQLFSKIYFILFHNDQIIVLLTALNQ